MTRALLALALCCMGCATPGVQATPEVPRLSCVNLAELPMAPGWFLYACRFNGPVPEAPTPPVVLEGS